MTVTSIWPLRLVTAYHTLLESIVHRSDSLDLLVLDHLQALGLQPPPVRFRHLYHDVK